MKILKILGVVVLLIFVGIGGALVYLINALPDVSPAPEIDVRLTDSRIERGRHLANNVMVCMHCHTPLEKNKFAHPSKIDSLGAGGVYFGPEEGLPGTFYSPNITPSALGDWTDGEIYRAITEGVSRDGRALFPIMPHPNYGQIQKEDIYSVIAYLRTLKPIENEIADPEISFPMNFIINTIPKPATHSLDWNTADPVNWGKYLVTAASCSDCHSPREKGAIIPGMEFAGGTEFPLMDGSFVRTSNITQDEITGIGTWSETDFINRFKNYADSSFSFNEVAAGQFNTAMPWQNYSKLSEDELKAIYAYLQTVPPVKNEVKRFTSVHESDTH